MIVRGIMSLNWIVYDVGKASSTESGLSSLRIWLSGGRPALLSRRAYLGRILFLKPPSALPLPTILVTLSHPIRAGQPETSLRHTGSLTVVARSVYGQPGPGLGHCYAMDPSRRKRRAVVNLAGNTKTTEPNRRKLMRTGKQRTYEHSRKKLQANV
ncbi:hypothetical protein LSTR_LSTR004721 [Laodelphax striatellus]|uniref:Uncharacterized protein n=1 Tax=Laodelphax striatellus TaxID=195883 RepID=A0A482WU64_LAOST|nr:hypothetical protein LSTR_LSTR004721 [Laodelphax striatellus]